MTSVHYVIHTKTYDIFRKLKTRCRNFGMVYAVDAELERSDFNPYLIDPWCTQSRDVDTPSARSF